MVTIITTGHVHALLHLKTLIDRLKVMEQSTLTLREREVVQESLQRAYEWAESLLLPDLLQSCLSREGQQSGGDLDVAQ
jgi:hypothetical protein